VTLSGRAKVGLAIATLVGIAAYLTIVDYGINAGRIHHGVDVRGIDVGGMTKEEATAVLDAEGERFAGAPVILTREGFSCNFVPHELGWDPRPFETAVAAYRIGRGESWWAALGARAKAWVAGSTVPWNDRIDPDAVGELLDRCEREATALGYNLRRHRLRGLIRDAITAPRSPVTIPVEG
jgi:hypothetical protein